MPEEAPAGNDQWDYAWLKYQEEQRLQELSASMGFNLTIIRRPPLYGNGWIPAAFFSRGWLIPGRIKKRKPVVLPGDGNGRCQVTHVSDFATALEALMRCDAARGQTVNVASREAGTWRQILELTASMMEVEPLIVCIPSDTICRVLPELKGELASYKKYNLLLNTDKMQGLIPDWEPRTDIAKGLLASLEWFEENPTRKVPNVKQGTSLESLLRVWEPFME